MLPAAAQMHERRDARSRGPRPTPRPPTAPCGRSRFRAVGGFDERARWGEDADLCFRLADAGWGLEPRPGARVRHLSRASVPQLLAQLSGHGAGAAWLHRRHPAEFAAPTWTALARRGGSDLRRALTGAARGDGARRATAALELLELVAFESGRLRSNTPRP